MTAGARGPAVSGRRLTTARRRGVATLTLAGVALVVALVALGIGDYPLSPLEVVRALTGTDGFASTIVLEWRLPRVLAALVFGAALGASGAIFQSLTRNPLGSPDVIGFSTGAYTGAIIVIVSGASSSLGTAGGALAGGLATALAVYLLAYRGGVPGLRLIIVGIGVTALLHSVNSWLLLRAQSEVALTASFWGAGSLALVGWSQLVPALVLLAVLTPLVVALSRPLRQLELGDDAARSHGLRAEGSRLALVVVGVALTAVVTASTGPIAFVALAAPQLARRLVRSAGVPLVAGAVTGAVLLLVADLVAQHIASSPVPVGLVTLVIGGVYLITLLVGESRRSA
ncbi:iron chelate uptake ABC transporter family permease subunit [Frigoribacterium sp. Leaf172]|uniref:FecCD family ABC transporter permease n=1 Tax=Frigoribacterium sp. Leaf172 TaxID=1736285 RepID=UPI0009E940DD|nr:iron chelate uptake ABC transporter family permease subunit [Frigoribacterium sp. Leaf172]